MDRDRGDMDSVTDYLKLVRLESYSHVFEDNGIDDVDEFFQLDDEKLEMLLPDKMGPRLKIRKLIRDIQKLKECLELVHQEHYFKVFAKNEISPEQFLELTKENLRDLLPEDDVAQTDIFLLIEHLKAETNPSEGAIAKNNDQEKVCDENILKEELKNTKNPKLKKALIIGGVGAAATGLAVVAAPLIIAGAGFGAAGVAAGSFAAAWQASIGSVAAGSLFASLQTAGAVGLAATTSAAIGATAGTVGAASAAGVMHLTKKSDQSDEEKSNTKE